MNMISINAKRAADICGFESVAILDYLQRSGVFVPNSHKRRRRGKSRQYEFRDLLVLKAIATLLKNGASVSALKKALGELQRRKWKADEASLQDDEGKALKYLIATGNSVVFAKSIDTLYDLTKHSQMLFSFILDMDQLHSDLCFQLRQRELPLIAREKAR
ncbi:MAG: MerR family transcriptional regulator [Sphingomonadaceae bacterium]